MADLSTTFTGIRFENPFLLASAPPTESDANIIRAFEAGWGGVVTKTIGLHPVVNVRGPKTKFLRATPESSNLSMEKRPGTSLHSSRRKSATKRTHGCPLACRICSCSASTGSRRPRRIHAP